MDGLKRGTVKLVAYKKEWKTEAENCISKLSVILKDDIIDAQHVGSTAIDEMCAKPIIDIAVGVKEYGDILKYNEILQENGILYRKQEHGDQILYVCGDMENDTRTHHIHVVIWNSEAWKNYINFRDYMNAHREAADKYAQLKEKLAKQYPNDRNTYTAEKQEFIDEILQKAAIWR